MEENTKEIQKELAVHFNCPVEEIEREWEFLKKSKYASAINQRIRMRSLYSDILSEFKPYLTPLIKKVTKWFN